MGRPDFWLRPGCGLHSLQLGGGGVLSNVAEPTKEGWPCFTMGAGHLSKEQVENGFGLRRCSESTRFERLHLSGFGKLVGLSVVPWEYHLKQVLDEKQLQDIPRHVNHPRIGQPRPPLLPPPPSPPPKHKEEEGQHLPRAPTKIRVDPQRWSTSTNCQPPQYKGLIN